jgi:hypothetical protein
MVILLLPGIASSQECVDYHTAGDCYYDLNTDFSVYSQSKSILMSATDTIEFNIVFYGRKDYIFSFCTHRKFYPIHFRLIDPDSGETLYDNKDDNYLESLGIGFDVTRNMIIKIDVLARRASDAEIEEYLACIGLLIQYKNYPEKQVNLKL